MEKKVLDGLEPKIVWNIFEDITRIPRPSKKEGKIRQWVKEWAKEHGVPVKEDDVGNILLIGKAAPGCEGYPTLALQAHMDMVCQKTPETKIDFESDPLKIKIVDDRVTAEGTSLGADNGIGMAYGMAAMISKGLKHGPLEVVLTVDEETGLTGAFGMEPGFFSGKYLLNVDSEALGEITISSAGGGGTQYTLPVTREKREDRKAIRLAISGLASGHSGVDIHLPRLNAIKVALAGLLELKSMDLLISRFDGGSVGNAIPKEAECDFLVPTDKKDEAIKILEKWRTLTEEQRNEPNMKIVVSEIDEIEAYTREQSEGICDLLSKVPHGPISWSKQIEGLVQTSNNLAIVKSGEDKFEVTLSSRSSVNKELEEFRNKLKLIGEEHGAEVEQGAGYPGWQADPRSPFIALAKSSYESILKREVALKAIHAGLECGLFSKLDPELQICSIGPDIKNPHTPDEVVNIKSVRIVWNTICRIMENMSTLG